MNKVICLLAILAMTAPALATVTFTVTPGDPCEFTVGYISDGTNPVGIALEASLDNGMKIVSASIPADPCFNAYIDYLHDNPPAPEDELPLGDPLAKQGAVAGYPVLPSSDVSLCMGRLVDDHSPGPATCELVTIKIDCSAPSCTMTLSLDSNRGGVVDANGDPITTNVDSGQGFILSCGPPCWSYDCFACGDSDGDCIITYTDALAVVNSWPPLPYDECADFDKDTIITYSDALAIVNHWNPLESCPSAEGCGPCIPE